MENNPVVLFDGVCNFCNVVVNFVIKHDKKKHFLFAPIQSKEARALLREHNEKFASLKTVYLIDNQKVYKRSAAIFYIFQKLPFPWKSLSIFKFLPRFITDSVYKMIAKNRYFLFGKKDEVIEPHESIKHRFIHIS